MPGFANLVAFPSTVVTASGGYGPATTPPNASPIPFIVPFDVNYFAVDINVSAASGTTPTLDIFVERLGQDGVWYTMYHPTQITGVIQVSVSLGPGDTAAAPTQTLRVRWAVGGTGPSFTFSMSMVGH
jgi:hypothetical protein